MTFSDGLQLYGAALTTLTILAASIKYVLSSRIAPIESDIKQLKKDNTRIEDENKEYSEALDELKQSLIDEVKEISTGNFEFRLKYDGAISEIKLLLAEKYVSKADFDKEFEEIKKRIDQNSQIHYEVKTIRKSIEAINTKEGKK
jgi:hypothetical protein